MKTPFYNIYLDLHTTETALETCCSHLQSGKKTSIYFVNAHCFNIAQRNEPYRELLKQGDLVLNDGIGIKLAATLDGIKLWENMNGTDFIPRILQHCQVEDHGVYFLGSQPGIIEKAAKNARKKFKNLNIKGYHHGYFHESQSSTIIDQINKSRATLLIVGMGVPRQEIWLGKHLDELNHVRLAVAGGAILDFLSGHVKRAPRWMRRLGMEWVYRIVQEPLRLSKRYFVGNFMFMITILLYQLNLKPKTIRHE